MLLHHLPRPISESKPSTIKGPTNSKSDADQLHPQPSCAPKTPNIVPSKGIQQVIIAKINDKNPFISWTVAKYENVAKNCTTLMIAYIIEIKILIIESPHQNQSDLDHLALHHFPTIGYDLVFASSFYTFVGSLVQSYFEYHQTLSDS